MTEQRIPLLRVSLDCGEQYLIRLAVVELVPKLKAPVRYGGDGTAFRNEKLAQQVEDIAVQALEVNVADPRGFTRGEVMLMLGAVASFSVRCSVQPQDSLGSVLVGVEAKLLEALRHV